MGIMSVRAPNVHRIQVYNCRKMHPVVSLACVYQFHVDSMNMMISNKIQQPKTAATPNSNCIHIWNGHAMTLIMTSVRSHDHLRSLWVPQRAIRISQLQFQS